MQYISYPSFTLVVFGTVSLTIMTAGLQLITFTVLFKTSSTAAHSL